MNKNFRRNESSGEINNPERNGTSENDEIFSLIRLVSYKMNKVFAFNAEICRGIIERKRTSERESET